MDSYSRLIAWLKVALPLMALGILSTLFLFSRDTRPISAIPFADSEIAARLQAQQVSDALFAGATSSGGRVMVHAERLLTQQGRMGDNTAEELSAQFELQSGALVSLESLVGHFSMEDSTAVFETDVVITTSDGFVLLSDLLNASLQEAEVVSPGPVSGTAPFGELEAGAMQLIEPKGQDTFHLVFTNGVKLLYRPQKDQ